MGWLVWLQKKSGGNKIEDELEEIQNGSKSFGE